jgi:hypothetical protein
MLFSAAMSSTVVPIMPALHELPDALRELRDARHRAFVWNYVFNGANGSAAARVAGYSDHLEAAKVRAHHLLQRDDIQAAMAALTGRYLFTLAPKAILRLDALLDDPRHPKHVKAIELTLDRTGHPGKTTVDVNVSGSVQVNHIDAALNDLGRMLDMGVPREKLVEAFGFSGLQRFEKMLAERRAREPRQIEGTVSHETNDP